MANLNAMEKAELVDMKVAEIERKYGVSWPTAKKMKLAAENGETVMRPAGAPKSSTRKTAAAANKLADACSIDMTESMMDRLWQSFPLGVKAAAIEHALDVEPNDVESED